MKNAVMDALLGTEPKLRLRLTRTLGACGVFLICLVIQFAAVMAGRADLSAALFLSVFILMGLGAFYLAIRSGWSGKFQDPAVTMPQAVFAIITLTLAYGINPFVRAMMPMIMALVLVFGAFILPPRRCRQLGWLAVASLAFVMLACSSAWPEKFDPTTEAFSFLMSAIVLPVIAFLAGELSELRHKLQMQKHELRDVLDKVRLLATHDELTGLPNRRQALEIFALEERKAHRQQASLCIGILDIDHFKQINDTRGHQAGDEALRMFSNILCNPLRAGDVLARWGGEEFMLLLPATTVNEAEHVIERMRQRCADPKNWSEHPELQVTFSAGLSAHVQDEPLDRAVARADAALYQAKKTGRNRLVVA